MNRYCVAAVGVLMAVIVATPAHAHAGPHHHAGRQYHAVIDDFHANPSTTDATGEIFLTLNHAGTELSYTILLDKLLQLKANPPERTGPDDIIGIHLHLDVPGTVGPHLLNIFGLATYNVPAEEDADLVIDYEHQTLTGKWDLSDATRDPVTGELLPQFFPLTSKVITDWIDELENGELMVAVHTNESGFPVMAIHGHLHALAPEPDSFVALFVGWCATLGTVKRGRREPAALARASRHIHKLPCWRVGLKWRTAVLSIVLGIWSLTPIYAQPAAIGEWSAVHEWPLEAVHTTLLPTGKVMVWQTWTESVGLWDPVTLQFSAADLPLHNPFCAGHAWLADGRLLVAGGHIFTSIGEPRANIYNPFTNTWADNVPNMPKVPTSPAPPPGTAGRDGRWYPSATTLGNGDVLVMAGDMDGDPDPNPIPQVYQAATNSWRNLTGAYRQTPLYPRTFLNPDGTVVALDTYSGTEAINPAGTGEWSWVGIPLENDVWNYKPAVMYEPGKIVLFGQGTATVGNVTLLDMTAANPTWVENTSQIGAAAMAQPRRQHTATILADGTVLVTGGTSSSGDNNNNPAGRVTIPEIWDPNTGAVTQVAAASDIFRGYHSTAILLPDGSVLSAGGDHDNPDFTQNLNAEIYKPAYLFQGPRPTVTSAPASAPLGRSFFVATPDAADITAVNAIVPGSTTHAQNWTQRINKLEFTPVPGGLAVTLPSNMNEMPLGYYMLFLINTSGVPSMANWIRALAPAPGLPGDFNADHVVDSADYIAWRKLNGSTYTYADYVDWQMNFGRTTPGAGGGVPEPGAAILCAVGLLMRPQRYNTSRLRTNPKRERGRNGQIPRLRFGLVFTER